MPRNPRAMTEAEVQQLGWKALRRMRGAYRYSCRTLWRLRETVAHRQRDRERCKKNSQLCATHPPGNLSRLAKIYSHSVSNAVLLLAAKRLLTMKRRRNKYVGDLRIALPVCQNASWRCCSSVHRGVLICRTLASLRRGRKQQPDRHRMTLFILSQNVWSADSHEN